MELALCKNVLLKPFESNPVFAEAWTKIAAQLERIVSNLKRSNYPALPTDMRLSTDVTFDGAPRMSGDGTIYVPAGWFLEADVRSRRYATELVTGKDLLEPTPPDSDAVKVAMCAGLTSPESVKIDSRRLQVVSPFMRSQVDLLSSELLGQVLTWAVLHEMGHRVLDHANERHTPRHELDADAWAFERVWDTRVPLFGIRNYLKFRAQTDDTNIACPGTHPGYRERYEQFVKRFPDDTMKEGEALIYTTMVAPGGDSQPGSAQFITLPNWQNWPQCSGTVSQLSGQLNVGDVEVANAGERVLRVRPVGQPHSGEIRIADVGKAVTSATFAVLSDGGTRLVGSGPSLAWRTTIPAPVNPRTLLAEALAHSGVSEPQASQVIEKMRRYSEDVCAVSAKHSSLVLSSADYVQNVKVTTEAFWENLAMELSADRATEVRRQFEELARTAIRKPQ
jgi:hypothetical protein